MREGCELTVRSPDRSESVVYEFSGQLIHEKLSATCKGTATQGSGSPKAGSDKRIAPVAGAGLTGGGASPYLVPGSSQPGGRLIGAASGRQRRPLTLPQALAERLPPWLPLLEAQRWSWTTSSKSNERREMENLELGLELPRTRFPI
jgi:hypothetical protein